MSIVDMDAAKLHLRELSSDLDPAIALAIEAAEAEVDNFIGGDPSAIRWPDEAPGDVRSAALLLVRVHFEEGDPEVAERWRGVAQSLLTPYRMNTGFGGA